jgi:hypothetical protein
MGSLKAIWLRMVICCALFQILGCRDRDDAGHRSVDLSGEWGFRLDTADQGSKEQWWEDAFEETIQLPGSLQEQGFGFVLEADLAYTGRSPAIPVWRHSPLFAPYRDSGKVKLSWALTPPRYYVGAAWYKKRVNIPGPLSGRPLRLRLERPHWTSDLWVDGQHIGQQNSLCIPHTYELDSLSAGDHELVLMIDNRMHAAIGPNAHSITDQTQTNWNGIIGRMELEPLPPVEITALEIHPDLPARVVLVRVTLKGHALADGEGTLRVRALGKARNRHRTPSRDYPVSWSEGQGKTTLRYPLGDQAALWDEFHPNVYLLEATLLLDDEIIHRTGDAFGMRQLAIAGNKLLINGRRIFLRGTLENAQYPMTGYPPMDVETWKGEMEAAQSFGLNHFRFHSWCPPEAAFEAADELGFYLQVEGPAWPERVDPGSAIGEFLFLESERILTHYGNHPSFVMFACGNEFGGSSGGLSYYPDSLLPYQLAPPAQVRQCLGAAFLGPWTDHFKQRAKGRQWISSAAGWPYIRENDYHIMHEPYRMRQVFDRLPPGTRTDYQNLTETHDVPLVSHETGQWCVYPDLSEAYKYTGFLESANLEIWHDFAGRNGVDPYAKQYHEASGQWQVLLYKQEIEAMLRTPGAGGFQLLGLTDYHGHGFAPVGVLDAFWNPKSYVSAPSFSRFCAPVVPLAKMDRRVWRNSETFTADIEIAQYYGKDLRNIPVHWEIRDGAGKLIDRGDFSGRPWPQGGVVEVGRIESDLRQVSKADRLTLSAGLRATPWQNEWEFWVYPKAAELPEEPEVMISQELDSVTLAGIEAGRKILFIPAAGKVRAVNPGGFESIFWSTWSGTGTLGILCQHRHPALNDFPTDKHTNWQWWELLRTSLPLDITGVDALEKPIVQVIDNWIRAHELALLLEFRIGDSRMMVCAMDIRHDLEERMVARQLRKSLLAYMSRDIFAPASQLSLDDFRQILGTEIRGLAALGATVYGSQEFPPNLTANLIDGDPETYWEAGAVPESHYDVVVAFPGYVDAVGLRLVPLGRGPDQPVVNYQVYLSHDGTDWGEPEGEGLFPPVGNNRETVPFADARNMRFVKIRFSEQDEFPVPYVSLAEIELILTKKNEP